MLDLYLNVMHDGAGAKGKHPFPTLLYILYIEGSFLAFMKKKVIYYTREITPVNIIVFHDTFLFNKLLVCVKNYFYFKLSFVGNPHNTFFEITEP